MTEPVDPAPAAVAPDAGAQLRAFARDIKLSHTIFALPFALSAAWLVSRAQPVPWTDWLWILVAMVGARSSAMGMNRIADRRIDAANPRTADRELASGRLTTRWAWGLTLGSGALLVLAAGLLHPLALQLSPLVLLWLWGYSFAKRFTALCHIWLGVALGLSPVCVWIALTGAVEPAAWVMGAIIATWVGGFDILYALQDEAYDSDVGLNSMPAWLGAERALRVSEGLHLATVGLLIALPLVLSEAMALGWPYAVGATAILGILLWEHRLVKPGDLSQMNKAFFQANSFVSVIFLLSVLAASAVG